MANDDEREFRLRPRKPAKPRSGNEATAWALAFKTVMHYARGSRSAARRKAVGGLGIMSPSIARSQRCAVRVTYARNAVRGQWRAHGRYVERESAAGSGSGVGFDSAGDGIDVAARLESWQVARDHRLWKIIVSPEFGERVDLTRLTRDLMTRVEQNVGIPMEWVAVTHFNTEHPHVHIALRGVGPERQQIHLNRDYIKYGIRAVAEDLCTRQLGYGHNESIVSNCHVRIAFAPNQVETAELLSKMTGTQTVQKASYNFSGSRFSPVMGHINASVDHIERPLMTPDEVLRLKPPQKQRDGDCERIVAPGQMLIFVSGNYPILGTQMLYFLDPLLTARAAVKPPITFLALEDGRPVQQRPIERTRNRISKPEAAPQDSDPDAEHPALGSPPREAFEIGLAQTGQRASRIIPYDREFIINTLPTTRTGTAKVDLTRGIKLNYLYYWCQGFDNPIVRAHRVDIRYDPFDASRAYAFVNGQWLECWSEYRHAFQGRSEREIILATQELRKQSRNHGQRSAVTAKGLAELLAAAEGQEAILAQHLKDREVRRDCAEAGVVPVAISGQNARRQDQHNVEAELPESGRSAAVIPAPQRIFQEF